MALQPFELFEHSKAILTITVVDANGDPVDLTGMAVHFIVHSLAPGTADGDNLIEIDSVNDPTQVTKTIPASGVVQVKLIATDLVIDETVEDAVEAQWQVRWENSAGADDVDLWSLPQPFYVRRNRAKAG